jgi:ABC-type bacteriocin/lantibiotic exporter with double-glycine peptidase domain
VRLVAKTAVLILSLCTAAFSQQTDRWIDVPFVQQPQEGCGAASIAMVMRYWQERQGKVHGDGADVSHIQQALFSDQAHGIYASDVQRYLDRHGFQTFVFRGDEALVQHHIEQGRPLIVALQPSSGTLLHYVVVAGVDRGQHVIVVNDPAQRKLLKIDSHTFDKQWQAAGFWTLLAVPRSDAR